ncbi:FAD binding domain-containing protein [Nocardiopsis flavescens]|uniref:Xanthine dehydrogenase YagS FAD-binding subunit n=1 Tax=Nocardiopsis flavescens TaxID=758803 RepID=A0A1M6C0P5_9ACTN|nr:xanthine dehydrogenase family protein subunit M [Nocardiopsis flavescens]SHI54586.1 xanthine dehydrogenase YagS FAD-binding subunit [Nocardiopsis flavescens]
MRPFAYSRPRDAAAAVAEVSADPEACYLAGGTNLVDHLRLGITRPGLLVDLRDLLDDGVEEMPGGGLRIGAATPNSDLAAHPLVRRRHPMLSAALLSGASGQLRNAASTGGNLLQRTRCAYFRDTAAPCNKREPGTGCSALEGHGRHNAVLGASRHCVAVHPSDMAVALTALDARVRVLGPGGERVVPLPGLHRLPGDEPHRDTVLEHGDLITAVELPDPPRGRRSAYRKVRDRASYAFALVSVAAALEVADGRVRGVRLALGGLAHAPWRARRAEEALTGAPATADAFREAARAELADARTGPDNAFKPALAVATVTAVLRDLAARGDR